MRGGVGSHVCVCWYDTVSYGLSMCVCVRESVCSLGTREYSKYLPHSQRKKFLGLGCTQVDLELLVRSDSLVAIDFQIVALL
jgi:hypothetical protein